MVAGLESGRREGEEVRVYVAGYIDRAVMHDCVFSIEGMVLV